MGFWTAITIIAIFAIGTEFILRLVKMGTRYSENKNRIKNGYPTLDGARQEDYAEERAHGERLQ